MDPLVGIVISIGIGVLLVVGAFAVASRSSTGRRWMAVGLSLGVAVAMTAIGMLISLFSRPESPPYEYSPVATVLSAAAMPGVLVMNVFGRRALDTIPYYGGFVLNIVLWSFVAYAVLRRARRA